MFATTFHKNFFFAALVFVVAGCICLYTQTAWWLLLPVFWLFLRLCFDVAISHTSQLFYILLFLLPLSAELNITPALGIDFPDEPLMMLLTALSLLLFIQRPALFPKNVLQHPLFFVLVLQLLWALVSCVFSTVPGLSIKFVLAKTWYIIPFAVLPSLCVFSKKDFAKLAACLLLPMAFVVVQSLARHASHQFSFEGIKDTLSPFFRNHVTYSGMLVCLFPLLVVIRKFSVGTYRTISNIGVVVAMIALLFAYSRGAWLALLCGGIAAVVIRFSLVKWMLAIGMFTVAASCLWLMHQKNYLQLAPDYNTTIFHEDLQEHLRATIELKDVSNAERIYRWVAATNMVADKPVVGFGPNTFYNNYKQYTELPFKTWVSDNADHSTVHNYFLLLLVEQGVPGCMLFIILFIGMLFLAQDIYRRHTYPFYKAVAQCIGVVLTMIGVLIATNDLVETDKVGSLFYLCLGLLFILDKQPTQSTQSR